jgi:hypothetical protein
MPPPDAVREGKVQPLADEDRRTILRWIDLGCPIDLDYDPAHPDRRGYGWMLDDNRPILTLALPRERQTTPLDRILIGMHDYDTGLDAASFRVTADFAVNAAKAGENLAGQFKQVAQGVWELKVSSAIKSLPSGRLSVSVRDKQGHVTRVERRFSVE